MLIDGQSLVSLHIPRGGLLSVESCAEPRLRLDDTFTSERLIFQTSALGLTFLRRKVRPFFRLTPPLSADKSQTTEISEIANRSEVMSKKTARYAETTGNGFIGETQFLPGYRAKTTQVDFHTFRALARAWPSS